MLDLTSRALHIVALGAHPDDIEIGCGGTLLKLAASVPDLTVEFVVATGDPVRLEEARNSAQLFLPGHEIAIRTGGLPDGRLPAFWGETKELLEETAQRRQVDLVLAPSVNDAHQDHRTIAEIVPTVWRDHLVLGYEIPKWDGDLGRPMVYVTLSDELVREKVLRLRKAFPSQASKDWFDDDVFVGLARLRGAECRAKYAEAFTSAKAVLAW
ncbi:MAG: PIG-L deacetylase family protein [Sporichthyaceae bacterium]